MRYSGQRPAQTFDFNTATSDATVSGHNHQPGWQPLDVSAAEARLRDIMEGIHSPVRVVDGHLRINESAMLRNNLYPVIIKDSTYYVVLWSADGALEILGVET